MKMILLPYRASMLIIGFAMLVAGLNIREDILVECGITKEKDATLHKCLDDSMDQKALVKRENPVIKQLFRKSMKCFPEEKTQEKSCYEKAMKEKFLQKKGNTNTGFHYNAGDMYFDHLRYTETLLKPCKIDRNNSPNFFACLDGLKPLAQRIIKDEKTKGLQAFESMADLLGSDKICYDHFTQQQGQCLLEQRKILKNKLTDEMEMHGKGMVEQLEKCGFGGKAIGTGVACTKPMADKIVNLSFQIFNKPGYAHQMWNLVKAMKTCVTKYTEVVGCLMPRSDDKPERQERALPPK